MNTEQNSHKEIPRSVGSSLRQIKAFLLEYVLTPILDNRHRTMLILCGTFMILFVLHLYHFYVLYNTGVHLPFLDFNKEYNIPTAFASLLMVFAGLLLFYIGFNPSTTQYAKHWIALGLVFIFLARDEYFETHDGLSEHFRGMVSEYDFLYFAWVVPYSFLLIVFAIVFYKFFFALPRRFRKLFAASGGLFILGAMGFEMAGAPRTLNYGRFDALYAMYTTIEESLEFIGMLLFNYSLLAYIDEQLLPTES